MRALFSFFFFPMNNGLLTQLPHKKKHPKKTKKKKRKKKCPSSSPLRLRPPTACTSATSRGRPPSRSYKRCSRTRRASRSQPCVSSSSSFVVVVAPRFVFCIPGGSFKARAEKSDDDGDQNRESADSFDDGIRASNRRRRKHARRRVAGPPSLSLSLSTGDDVNDDDEKGRHVSRVDETAFVPKGNTKGPSWCESFRLRRRR